MGSVRDAVTGTRGLQFRKGGMLGMHGESFWDRTRKRVGILRLRGCFADREASTSLRMTGGERESSTSR